MKWAASLGRGGQFSEALPVTDDPQQRPRQFHPVNWSHSPTRAALVTSVSRRKRCAQSRVTLSKTTVVLAGARMSPLGWHPGTTRGFLSGSQETCTLKCPKPIDVTQTGVNTIMTLVPRLPRSQTGPEGRQGDAQSTAAGVGGGCWPFCRLSTERSRPGTQLTRASSRTCRQGPCPHNLLAASVLVKTLKQPQV